MERDDREQILAMLAQGRTALPAAVAGLTEEQEKHIPGPGRWSIFECVEHIATSEDYMFTQIAQASDSAIPAINLAREAKMLARGTDRSRRIESPVEGHPRGAFPSLDAAVAHFLESRDRTIAFVRENREDLRSKMTWHPILKEANCHEMLLSICLHSLRHVKQIEEIRADLALEGTNLP